MGMEDAAIFDLEKFSEGYRLFVFGIQSLGMAFAERFRDLFT